ncbi:unannotated protein [freshwater metagenome]|uniref:Unannotated protein n=1 Tax=freshwater metagenome TaxID=449393 RepID=A0A6J7S154_9ZZZZ
MRHRKITVSRRTRVSQRINAVIQRELVKYRLKCEQLFGVIGRQINRLGKVVFYVVQLPHFLGAIEGKTGQADPGEATVKTRCHPALVINRPVTKYFEILRAPAAFCRRVGERVRHRYTVHIHLGNAIYARGRSDAHHFINGGRDVDHMMKLSSKFTGGGYLVGPRNRYRVAGTAKMRGHLLHPLKRRIQRPSPADIEVVFTSASAKVVHMVEQPLGVFGLPVLK